VHRGTAGTWTWDYESNTTELAIDVPPPVVRVPRADDLVPANLARRLLGHATAQQVTRLPSERIAGRSAAGLRMKVSDKRSTVDHIDVWALPDSGLPMRVSAHGKDGTTVVSSTLLDVDLQRPPASVTAFAAPAGSQFPGTGFGDIVSAINQFGDVRPPASIGGTARQHRPAPRCGGRLRLGRDAGGGPAALSARLAGTVVPALRSAPGAVEDARGIALAQGPISVQLSPPTGFGARWLLVGTVTGATLKAAVPSLPPAQDLRFRR